MEEWLPYVLIGGGILAMMIALLVFYNRKPSASQPQEVDPAYVPPRKVQASSSSKAGRHFEDVVQPEAVEETSAADLDPLELSSNGVRAMVSREGNRRLSIQLRPNLLPGNPEQQKQAFIDVQKHWIKEVISEMHGHLEVRETDHFLLVTDAPKQLRDFLKNELEIRYREFIGFFCLDLNPELWDGKLCVFLFEDDNDFRDFATRLDGFTPRMTDTGYVRIDERLAHIVLRRGFDELGVTMGFVQHFTTVMCHYLAGGENLSRWVQEGLAIFMQTQSAIGEGYREAWFGQAVKAVSFRGEKINALLNGTVFLNPSTRIVNEALSCAFALVELLVASNHELFLKVLARAKRGQDAERSIQKLYGADVVSIWQVWESQNVPQMKKSADDSIRRALDVLRSISDPEFQLPNSGTIKGIVRSLTESRPELSSDSYTALQASAEAMDDVDSGDLAPDYGSRRGVNDHEFSDSTLDQLNMPTPDPDSTRRPRPQRPPSR